MSGDDYSNGFLTTNVMFGTGLVLDTNALHCRSVVILHSRSSVLLAAAGSAFSILA